MALILSGTSGFSKGSEQSPRREVAWWASGVGSELCRIVAGNFLVL